MNGHDRTRYTRAASARKRVEPLCINSSPHWLRPALDEAAVMKTFTINPANHVRAYASNDEALMPDGGVKFASEKKLTALAVHWPVGRLVEIWNKLPGVETIRKFTD